MSSPVEIVKRFEEAQSALVLQASDLSLQTIAAMVQSGAIDVTPQFQRRERWDAKRQSALVESFVLNIPVPPVYLSEDEYGMYSVIDGKQQITAITQFIGNEFPLRGLERFPGLSGLRFDELPSPIRNALTVRPYVQAITILNQSSKTIKYEVFHRLNSGGEPLNAQEIRNVLFRGALNDLLMELAENQFLRDRLKIRDSKSSAYQKMLDAEFVLRFLTLRDGGADTFTGDFRPAMDTFMEENQNLTKEVLQRLRDRFLRAVENCHSIWGDVAFKRPDKNSWRDQTLAGMYDAQMLAVDEVEDSTLRRCASRSAEVVQATRVLFADDLEFEDAVRTATNTPSKLRYRVEKMVELLTGF